VPKAQMLLALEATWAGLAAAVQHLRQQQHLPASCCFDMRHFRRCLQSLVAILSEHIAQQDSNKYLLNQVAAAAADQAATPTTDQASPATLQKSSGSVWNVPTGTPKTPNTPGVPPTAVPLTPATPSAALPYSPSVWRLSQTAPGTPTAASAGMQPAAAAALVAGAGRGIGGRKVPLKTICCAVLEVLCRRVLQQNCLLCCSCCASCTVPASCWRVARTR
jgi:hypothetical protein